MPSFGSTLKIGDILYSLLAIQRLGGGKLYLSTKGPLTQSAYESLLPLLEYQEYLEDVVEWNGEKVDYDLTAASFRGEWQKYPLVQRYLYEFDVDTTVPDGPWIKTPAAIPSDVLVSVTNRYHGAKLNWESLVPDGAESAYIGIRPEWVWFCLFNHMRIPFIAPNDLLIAAQYIAGCNLFIGNETGNFAIAMALNKNCIVGLSPEGNSCFVPSKGNIQYFVDSGYYDATITDSTDLYRWDLFT